MASPHPLLFLNLKKSLAGKHFESNVDVTAAVNENFKEFPERTSVNSSQYLHKRLTKCVELTGEYTEKLLHS